MKNIHLNDAVTKIAATFGVSGFPDTVDGKLEEKPEKSDKKGFFSKKK